MFEAIKMLSPKQRFLGLVIIALISAATSLGTAYMNGSDCEDISEKYTKSVENYTKSIENYNRLVDITDETQRKYLKAKQDILLIQEQLKTISEMMSAKKQTVKTTRTQAKAKEYKTIEIDYDTLSVYRYGPKMDSGREMLWKTLNAPEIKERVVITKTESPKKAKCLIDSLIKITKKYDNKK